MLGLSAKHEIDRFAETTVEDRTVILTRPRILEKA